MNPHLIYFEKQQEKKRRVQKNNQIALINQNLKLLLQQVQEFIDRKKYEKDAFELSRPVVWGSIWDITYRNNMENPEVAIAQGILISRILKNEEENIKNGRFMLEELERLMRQLGNIDWSFYVRYNQLKAK